jgi:hypothetical protein
LIATDSTKSSKKMIEKSKGCRRRCERECMWAEISKSKGVRNWIPRRITWNRTGQIEKLEGAAYFIRRGQATLKHKTFVKIRVCARAYSGAGCPLISFEVVKQWLLLTYGWPPTKGGSGFKQYFVGSYIKQVSPDLLFCDTMSGTLLFVECVERIRNVATIINIPLGEERSWVRLFMRESSHSGCYWLSFMIDSGCSDSRQHPDCLPSFHWHLWDDTQQVG